jgi:hypothetical protein
MIQASYRSDYAGEFVVVETRWAGGKKQQQREWVPNPIENHHISGRSACIGTDSDYDKFDYTRLQRHRGGLLGSKKLQTYGTGTIAKKMRLDFAAESNEQELKNFIDTKYNKNNVIYTSAKNCLTFPENFYLVPYNPKLLDLATIVYLAAFDGHSEIFLLGYNKDSAVDVQEWYLQISKIIDAYSATRFYFVGESTNMYSEWLDHANAECMNYRQFISYCDV